MKWCAPLDEQAARLGLTVDQLEEHIRITNEILEEILLEEDVERAEARGVLLRSES